ncbi:MAG TPA: SMP-30/gluconolactonase/LRE family protein [Polyangiales bacterium]|nr:SMP-30/gluconolactonase/LRE family protein [Polyangiales bacterium]
MNQRFNLVLGMLVVLAGCESSSSESIRACVGAITAGEVEGFGTEIPRRTEGIVFDAEGNLFVSAISTQADDQLLSIDVDGTPRVVAEATSILGLASHANGILAAAIETGELLLIEPADGTIEVIADDLGAPNFVVTTPWDTMLVSDDTVGENTIDEVTWDGRVSTWVQGVPTPNGMVFSPDQRMLYVASTFEEPGLWRVPVSEDGQAGVPEKWVAFELTTPDGVAIDGEGNVYVALNTTGEIARVDPEGNATIVAEGVDWVASLAFGRGDFDPCSIYATSLFDTQLDTQLWRVRLGTLGVEN